MSSICFKYYIIFFNLTDVYGILSPKSKHKTNFLVKYKYIYIFKREFYIIFEYLINFFNDSILIYYYFENGICINMKKNI